MKAELTEEHAFLRKLVGLWDMVEENGGPATGDHAWRETVRSLHGIWFLAEGRGKMPDGADASSVLTLGYDPAKGKYVGSWIGSMMNHMWVYEGVLDPDGRTLRLDTSGPDFEKEGVTARYREELAFENDDDRTFTSYVMKPDGAWHRIMQVRYRRIG
jgi:hypothetical protein